MHESKKTATDQPTEAEWQDQKFDDLIKGQGNFDVGRKLTSKN